MLRAMRLGVRSRHAAACCAIVCILTLGHHVVAQDTASVPQPAAAPPTSVREAPPADNNGTQAIFAKAIDVHGDVRFSTPDNPERQKLEVGGELGKDAQIWTGIGASVLFQIGDEEPYTALVIDSVGKVILSEAHKTADTKRVRIGVGYGKIRAGVAEGGLKSDFTVDSPVASLSKRGTWNFGLSYTRGTGEFEVFLLERGLVEAINNATNQRRLLRPREAVTQAMRTWALEANIRRNVAIPDLLGQDDLFVAVDRGRNSGLGVTGPGQGGAVFSNTSNRSLAAVNGGFGNNLAQPITGTTGPTKFRRPEGYFGTGRGDGLIEAVFDHKAR